MDFKEKKRVKPIQAIAMLLTGIASPKQMLSDLQEYTDAPITHLSFGDHHQFKPKDIRRINDTFSGMSSPLSGSPKRH